MNIGIVVIGRNEGERLGRCLDSVASTASHIVYVDSGSSDQSITIAKAMKVGVVELDPSIPFSAARARNEGFAYLLRKNPAIAFVQFVDGDCTLHDGWLAAASNALTLHADYAAVVGHLRELHPEASVYNRLCALEWRSSPVGDLTKHAALGGISMIRASVFEQLDGFNPQLIAGEEPELAIRMARAGYKVVKLDQAMALHDADMHRFSQWWKRAVRSGHAIGQRVCLAGHSDGRDNVRKRNSTWFWGVGLPLFIALTALPTHGWSLLLVTGYPVLGARIYRYCRSRGNNRPDSLLYGCSIVVAKFAEAIGMIKFHRNRCKGCYQIIEYK